jgi:hypothetical protein
MANLSIETLQCQKPKFKILQWQIIKFPLDKLDG